MDLERKSVREFLKRKALIDFGKARTHSNEKLRSVVNYTPKDLEPRKK